MQGIDWLLADKIFIKEAEKINLETQKASGNLLRDAASRGILFSSMFNNKWTDIRVQKAERLLDLRIQVDTDIVVRSKGYIDEEDKKIILERSKAMIENGIKTSQSATDRLHLKGNIHQEIIRKLESRKHKLYAWAEREVDIKQRQVDLERRRIASEDRLVLQLMREVDIVNALFKKRYQFNLINVEQQRIWGDLLKPCKAEDDFNNMISSLSNLIDWINVQGIKGLIQKPPENGSINLLEAFLKKEYPSYDPNIIKRLRRIKKIRKKYPIHKDLPEVIEAFKEIEDYPPTDWQRFWDKILTDFLLSLSQIRECLSS